MNKACDLLALAISAYRTGEYDAAAKFFASAMGSEDLDSFVSDITKSVPRSALQGPVPGGENTLSPSLASGSSDLYDVVERIEAGFRAECSLLDYGDEEDEVRASDDDDILDDDDLDDGELDYDDDEDELEDDADYDEDFEVEASTRSVKRKFKAVAGPVRLRK